MSRGPDDFGGGPGPKKSGIVTALAVINFVFGAINLICGGLGLVAMGTLLSLIGAGKKADISGAGGLTPEAKKAAEEIQKAAAQAGDLATVLATFGTILALGLLIAAILEIAGGVGQLQRAPWGRILGLVAGAILLVEALFFVVKFFDVCSFLFLIIPALFNLIILLLPGPAADFRARAGTI